MANIRENKRDGKLISYRFTVCLGRDANNKQIRRYTTWDIPEGLTPAKAKKAAERAADAWEREEREEYQKEKELGEAYTLPPEKRRDSFTAFVNDVWFPLQVCNGNDKQTTITFYKNMKKLIVKYFDGMVLQEISPLHIQKFLAYLSRDYRTKQGKPLAPKTIRHYFNALGMIFAYAEKQNMIAANPMQKVDAPKKDKKPVDALTVDDARWLQAEIGRQARESYISGQYELGKLNMFGQRINIRVTIPKKDGFGDVSFVTGWMVKPNGQIKLNTPYGGK